MLARPFRLPATVLFQNAKVFYNPYFTVRVLSNDLLNSRFGFIAGKKLDKRAVVRNKLKRRVRSVIEKDWLGLKGKDVLFVLKPTVTNASFEEISLMVRGILGQLS